MSHLVLRHQVPKCFKGHGNGVDFASFSAIWLCLATVTASVRPGCPSGSGQGRRVRLRDRRRNGAAGNEGGSKQASRCCCQGLHTNVRRKGLRSGLQSRWANLKHHQASPLQVLVIF